MGGGGRGRSELWDFYLPTSLILTDLPVLIIILILQLCTWEPQRSCIRSQSYHQTLDFDLSLFAEQKFSQSASPVSPWTLTLRKAQAEGVLSHGLVPQIAFAWVQGIWTQVLTGPANTTYPVNHLLCPKEASICTNLVTRQNDQNKWLLGAQA